METAIYTLTSGLHDEEAVGKATKEFLGNIGISYKYCGNDFNSYGSYPLELIFVRTGGTEGIFLELLPRLLSSSIQPFYLLSSGNSNSLAASMEILSLLRQKGLRGEILHGSAAYLSRRISTLEKVAAARNILSGCRLGVVGKPSDWLVASKADVAAVRERLGIEIVDIAMEELLETVAESQKGDIPDKEDIPLGIRNAIPGAMQIYHALKTIIARHNLQGFTLRCFDLLPTLHNTGCLALAKLNAEGYVAGCEGDVPAMISMMAGRAVTGVSGFQANPATIDPESGEVVFAHCTIPLNMLDSYEYDTHFESGIGVAIRGFVKEGPVTIFKMSGDMQEYFAEEGQLLQCGKEAGLCRTQMHIRLDDKNKCSYFLTRPIGNHHIILPGRHKDALEELME